MVNKFIEKTVFSQVYPETENMARKLYKEEEIYKRHRAGYTRVQDAYHETFREAYLYWSKPVVKGLYSFPHFYPSAGSSEAIREVIAKLGKSNTTLHMFEGEYEGYRAYAEEHGVEICYWNRDNYKEKLHKYLYKNIYVDKLHYKNKLFTNPHIFFISQPSGIDGMVWEGYPEFIAFAEEIGLQVYVDLAYVGAVATEYFIDVESPAIQTVFISLSKSFGTYGRRIGGVFSRNSLGGLFGNMWFKNYDSLYIGENLLNEYGVYDLPKKYAATQDEALKLIVDKSDIAWEDIFQSDVILLARVNNAEKYGLKDFIRRPKDDFARICISPAIDFLI